MSFGTKAQLFPGLRFIFLCIAVSFCLPTESHAICPPGSDFSTRNHYSRSVSVANPDRSINEGSYSLTMDLTLPIGDASINISSGGFTPLATISLSRWQWRLRVLRPTSLTPADLIISYQVTGSDGATGVLTSDQDPSSYIQATVSTREIRQRQGNNRRRFLGYIDLDLDYTNATRAGRYSGTITVTVDCP